MPDWSDIGAIATRVRQLREAAGLTQAQLAERAGTDEKFVQQIEAARKKQIWVSTVDQLAKAMGLKLAEFFQQSPPQPRALPRPKKPQR